MKSIPIKYIDKWSEETLIRECLYNNEKAQKYLFESYQSKMFALCMRYLDNEDEAFDVLNQAFLKVFNNLNQFKGTSKIEAWIRRIIINTTLDYLRKNKSYRSVFVNTQILLDPIQKNAQFILGQLSVLKNENGLEKSTINTMDELYQLLKLNPELKIQLLLETNFCGRLNCLQSSKSGR